jgi:hypothetical protein
MNPQLLEFGQKLRHKPTGKICEIVPHDEPLAKGYALGLGTKIYNQGISIRLPSGHYNFVYYKDLDKYFEEVN